MRRAFAAAVLLSATAFVIAETAARRLTHMDALVYQDSADPRLGFELRPGAHGMKVGVPVEINAEGMRDDSVPSEKPAGERRVVVGGHETFGLGVASQDTFVRRLAEGLLPPGSGKARTINLSMYSYSLSQKLELACTRLTELKPDVVVLQTAENDLKDLPPPAVSAPRLKNWVREHSEAARWAAEMRYLARVDPAPEPAPARVDAETTAANFAKTREHLRRFEECARAAGASKRAPPRSACRSSTPVRRFAAFLPGKGSCARASPSCRRPPRRPSPTGCARRSSPCSRSPAVQPLRRDPPSEGALE